MGLHGHDLAVQLTSLWSAGAIQLPDVAKQFTAAADSLDSYAASAFYRSGELGAGGSWGAYDAWRALADTLDGILADTADAIADTGRALVMAANDYDGIDDGARQEFESRKSELEATR